MIELIICLLLPLLFGAGIICGQHSVWKSLREKGRVTIDGWYYTAEYQYKHWD